MRLPFYLLIFFTLILLVGRFFLATSLELFGDEAFYWMESKTLALAYSDQPLITALIVKISTLFSTNPSTLVLRSLFLLIGTLTPFACFYAAKPLTGTKNALYVAIACLALPLIATLGVLALPDVPLTVISIFAFGLLIRALQHNELRHWIGLGICCALGMMTHYRFSLFLFSFLLVLMLTPVGRKQWKNPYLWVTAGITSIGFIPVLWFNLNYQLSGFMFHFHDRHPWSFNSEGLLYPVVQFFVVSPALFIAFFVCLILSTKKALQGNTNHAITSIFSLTIVGVFYALAPWADQRSTTFHWPLFGYIPALIWLPYWLQKLSNTLKGVSLTVITLSSIACLLTTFSYFAGMANIHKMDPPLANKFSSKMIGWKAAANDTKALLTEHSVEQIVYVNYYTLAQFNFQSVAPNLPQRTIDIEKSARDGRLQQLIIWQQDTTQVQRELATLVVFDTSHFTPASLEHKLQEICSIFPKLHIIKEADYLFSRRSFIWLTNTLPKGSTNTACGQPSQGWIDTYPDNYSIQSGTLLIEGWASNNNGGIKRVDLVIDDKQRQTIKYGLSRDDILTEIPDSTDPNLPKVGYKTTIDTTLLTNGWHKIQVTSISDSGKRTHYRPHWIMIDNPPTGAMQQ